MFTLSENGSENKTNIPSAVCYDTVFKQLRSVLVKKIDDALFFLDSAPAGWALQLAYLLPSHLSRWADS